MLTRETIQDIVECRLPDDAIRGHLEELTGEKLSLQVIQHFVDALFETLDQPSRQLASITGTIDTSGTGGSGIPHFNTSTTVAFILAAGDVSVTKFGNRAAQSQCGSFDLLEALGVPSIVPPEAVPELLERNGIAFLFAPQYYPGLAKLAPLRKAMSKRTVFNSLGPLLNPVRPYYRVMGVSCEKTQPLIADYLSSDRVTRRALVVRSPSGLDELEPHCENTVYDTMQGYVNATKLMAPAKRNGCDCGTVSFQEMQLTPQENYKLFFELISGDAPEWLVDLVCVNAAAGFVANCCSSIDACFEMARELIQSGKVKAKVEDCRRAYAKFATR